MKPSIATLIVCLAVCCQFVCGNVSAEVPEILLWPNGAPEPTVPADPPEKTEIGKDGIQRRYNVSQPKLFVYLPPEGVKRSGAAMIVVPGGGFTKLADGHEGADAAVWLAKQGIVAFSLAHRTPTDKHPQPNLAPIQDVQKSVIEVRKRANEFGYDGDRIGVFGFSAGGQATIIAATNEAKFETDEKPGAYRPNLLMLLYAYQIYDPAKKGLRSEINLDYGLPPTFIAQMGDDTGSLAQGSALLYLGLIERKIPAELHIYQKGGHGFGMNARPNATGPTDWQGRGLDWLRLQGYIAAD